MEPLITSFLLISMLASNSTYHGNDSYNPTFFCVGTPKQVEQTAQCNDYICKKPTRVHFAKPYQATPTLSRINPNQNKQRFGQCKHPLNTSSSFHPRKGRK